MEINKITQENNFSCGTNAYDDIKVVITLESRTTKDVIVSGSFSENITGSITNSGSVMTLDLKEVSWISGTTNREVGCDGYYYNVIKFYSGVEMTNSFQEEFQVFFFTSQKIQINSILKDNDTTVFLGLKEWSQFLI